MKCHIIFQLCDHLEKGTIGRSNIFVSTTNITARLNGSTLRENLTSNRRVYFPQRRLEVLATLIASNGLYLNFNVAIEYVIDVSEPF